MAEAEEILWRVDTNDDVIGTVARSEVKNYPDWLYRVVMVVLTTANGDIYLQQRASNKSFPLYWTTTISGHVPFGEHYLEAAYRETYEESGLALASLSLLTTFIETEAQRKMLGLVYGEIDNAAEPAANPEEVAQFLLVSEESLFHMLQDSETAFTPPARDVFNWILNLR